MRPSLRNALLGLVDQVPLIGSGITRAIQDHYPSPREREQAELIARQQDRVRDLAGEVKRQNYSRAIGRGAAEARRIEVSGDDSDADVLKWVCNPVPLRRRCPSGRYSATIRT
jgi:hypothetical protein